jgi:hypothetical protein
MTFYDGLDLNGRQNSFSGAELILTMRKIIQLVIMKRSEKAPLTL